MSTRGRGRAKKSATQRDIIEPQSTHKIESATSLIIEPATLNHPVIAPEHPTISALHPVINTDQANINDSTATEAISANNKGFHSLLISFCYASAVLSGIMIAKTIISITFPIIVFVSCCYFIRAQQTKKQSADKPPSSVNPLELTNSASSILPTQPIRST